MDTEILLYIGLAVIALPMLGNLLAMALGVTVTLGARHTGHEAPAGAMRRRRVENRLRRAAALLGSRIRYEHPPVAVLVNHPGNRKKHGFDPTRQRFPRVTEGSFGRNRRYYGKSNEK